MKTSFLRILMLMSIYALINISTFAQNHPIYVGQTLSQGYDIGVNSSSSLTSWLSDSSGYMKMSYPSGQIWGAVFITIGPPVDSRRPFKNFSMYSNLSLELKGAKGGEVIEIGIKDNTDLDNGQETKIAVTITKEWRVYEFPLVRFSTADLSHLYVPVEFVFGGNQSETVYFRNISYNR